MTQKAETMNKIKGCAMYNFLQEIKSDQNLFHSLNPQSIEHSVSDRTAISVSGSRLKAVFGHLYPFENLSVSV